MLTGERSVVSTLAGGLKCTDGASADGNGAYPFADGNGTSAAFSGPGGVAVDASGNVFVADTNNGRIRKVTAGGGTQIGQSLCALAGRTPTVKHRHERVERACIKH